MLNQLFDGEGDKTTLAQNRERVVPKNSTSITVSLQPEAYAHGLVNLGSSLWSDSGFGERFLVTAIKPYRYTYLVNHIEIKLGYLRCYLCQVNILNVKLLQIQV